MDVENNNFTLSEDINGPLLAAVIGIEMLAGLITNSFVLILTFCYFRTERKPSTIGVGMILKLGGLNHGEHVHSGTLLIISHFKDYVHK